LTADNLTRTYGSGNPPFTFTASGLVNGDSTSDAVAGSFGSSTVPGSNVGAYSITGSFASPVGYRLTVNDGTLTVNAATLFYVANPASRLQGAPNPAFAGSVSGFVNGDTLASAATGVLTFASSAAAAAPPGRYAINGSGLDAANYVFSQAPGNASALTVLPTGPSAQLLALMAEVPAMMPAVSRDSSYEASSVYGKNFGLPGLCLASGPLAAQAGSAGGGDLLAVEWSRVRLRPNLSNCLDLGQRNGCQDF
jgi:hypothetical protein